MLKMWFLPQRLRHPHIMSTELKEKKELEKGLELECGLFQG